MASPHIGCKEKELIYISTKKFDLTIKGKPCHPKSEALNNNVDSISKVTVSCKDDYSIEIFSTKEQSAKSYLNCTSYNVFQADPIFYEHQNYEIIIENKCNYEIQFWHDNVLLREKVDYIGKSKNILTGILNFKNEIGFSELKIYVDGISYLTLNIELFPSKIDYQEDYLNILRDVNSEIYNLAFDFIKKTYLWSSVSENRGSSLTEFFSIISIIFDKFKAATDIILRTPHHILQHENNILPFHKIKKSNNETIKWLQKNPQNLMQIEDKYIPQKALVSKKNISFDTFENRFIKYILNSILKRLENLKQNYLKLDRKSDDNLIKTIENMQREIQKRIEFSFLKNVGDLHTLNTLSLVLNMAPGYKDVYKYYLMLIKGLSLSGEVFKISVKDLSVLYEYWCFIKLNSLLKNKYKLINQDLIKIDNRGIFVTLSKGKKASVTYENPKNGEKFTVTYNPSVRELPTVSQRPDNTLTLEKHRSKIKYEYIFDAKYKINPALQGTPYKQSYSLPGPEEEDINTMHRYRDAIVHSSSDKPDFERTMFGAYILFPYNDEEEYKQHKFYTSIEKVSVGGLPFLPSATNLVKDFLQELIDDSPESAFERTNLPKGLSDYINSINFEERDVLVGSLRNKQQLEVNLKYNFYHIPYSKLKKNGITFKYIAIYQSKDDFKEQAGIRYYGRIKDWEIVKRKDIKEIPKNSDELYIRFNIEEWKTLNNPIKPKEYWVRSHIYTNKVLLMNAEYLPELCIRTKEEYRLFIELKRITNKLNVGSINEKIDEDDATWFEFESGRVSVENGMIRVFKEGGLMEVKVEEFRRKPKGVVGLISNFIKHVKDNISNR